MDNNIKLSEIIDRMLKEQSFPEPTDKKLMALAVCQRITLEKLKEKQDVKL